MIKIAKFLVLYIFAATFLSAQTSTESTNREVLLEHAKKVETLIKSQNFEDAEQLLSEGDLLEVKAFNLAFSSFYELYVNWDFDSARNRKLELNESFSESIDLEEYNKMFGDAYSHLDTFEKTEENRSLGQKMFSDDFDGSKVGVLKMHILLATGIGISSNHPISRDRIRLIEERSANAKPDHQVISGGINEPHQMNTDKNPHVKKKSELESTSRPPVVKPAIKAPAEVVTIESTEEPIEKSSNWWIWLIGVVVLGSFGFVLRRKI